MTQEGNRRERRTTAAALIALLALAIAAGLASRAIQPVRAAGPPGVPGTPAAIAQESSANVYWTAASGAVDTYQVVASPGGASTIVGGTYLSANVPGLTDATAYTFTVTAGSNSAGPGPASAASNAVVPGRGAFKAVSPARILDTRGGSPLGPGGIRTLSVDGAGGLPASGISAVWLNVTATNTTAMGFLAIWPAGLPRPPTSNLNWTAGRTVPNLVEVALGVNDQVSFYNSAGSTDLVVDVFGYVALPASTATAGMYNPVAPHRVLDTRIGLGASKAQLCAGQVITVKIAGTAGVPSTGATAVVLNVTAVNTVVAPSFVTVFPAGTTRPNTSNLNFVPGQTVANRVVVPLGSNGSVSFYDFVGHLDVVADVNGWFTSTASGGSGFVGVLPIRHLDTRTSPVLWQGGVLKILLGPSKFGSVPPTAIVLNVTVTNPTTASWLTVWPDGTPRPTTSDLNYGAGKTVSNLVVVMYGGSPDKLDIYNAFGHIDLIVDFLGWYE